jgi:hypothetical protein
MWAQCKSKHCTHLLMVVNYAIHSRHCHDAPSSEWAHSLDGLGSWNDAKLCMN